MGFFPVLVATDNNPTWTQVSYAASEEFIDDSVNLQDKNIPNLKLE